MEKKLYLVKTELTPDVYVSGVDIDDALDKVISYVKERYNCNVKHIKQIEDLTYGDCEFIG